MRNQITHFSDWSYNSWITVSGVKDLQGEGVSQQFRHFKISGKGLDLMIQELGSFEGFKCGAQSV